MDARRCSPSYWRCQVSATNDGGPAFPAQDWQAKGNHHPGMSVRDWFAGQALAGLMAHPTAEFTAKGGAAIAYEFADAMLRAREGGAK